MQDGLLALLRSSGADAWSVTDEKKLGWQFYYVRHQLDQNRVVNTEHITVTVYRKTEGGRFLGSATEEIAPTATEDEMRKAIADLLSRAEYVENPAYALRRPAAGVEEPFDKARALDSDKTRALDRGTVSGAASSRNEAPEGNSAQALAAAVSKDFIEAMTSLPETRTEDVNSYEIFVNEIERRLVTSTGIDETQRYPSSMLEVVVNARNEAWITEGRDLSPLAVHARKAAQEDTAEEQRNGEDAPAAQRGAGGVKLSAAAQAVRNASGERTLAPAQADGSVASEAFEASQSSAVSEAPEEIELYRMYTSGTCDRAGLQRDITRTFQYAKDRLHTVPTPKLDRIPVVFSTADAVQIYDYFVGRMGAQQVYQKISDWQIGKAIADDVKGDKLTVTAKKFLPNSSQNFDFDAEGATIRDEVLIRDDVAENYWGNAMFSSYLGLPEGDTFIVSNYAVSGGTRSEEEIRSGRYLEVVEFSDFQVDGMTGAVYGEIRLGYLHEADGRVTCVTGGSVSGSMLDYVKEMYLSRESAQYDNARIPALTKLMNVVVTGAGR